MEKTFTSKLLKPAEAVRAGLDYARAHGTKSGKEIGRPKAVFHRDEVPALRAAGLSWRQIAHKLHAGVGTVRRVYQETTGNVDACQNPSAGML